MSISMLINIAIGGGAPAKHYIETSGRLTHLTAVDHSNVSAFFISYEFFYY